MSSTIIFRQSVNSKITSNHKKEVSAEKIREVLVNAADAIDEGITTSIDNTVLAGAYRDEAKQYSLQSSANREEKGDWNPVTNTPALTANATVGSNWVPGVSGKPQSYTISTAGNLPFAIKGQAAGTAIDKGYLVQHPNGQWYYDASSTVALTKIIAVEQDVQKNLLVVDKISGEIVTGFGANNGDYNPSTKVIIIPNTVSGAGTGLIFTVTRLNQYTWKTGDTVYVEAIVNENTPGITNIGGQVLQFNLNVKRNASGTITTVNNAAASVGFQRLSTTQVKLTLTYVVTATDTEFAYVVQKPTGSAVNNSGGGWVFTVQEVNCRITIAGEKLPQISAAVRDLSAQIEDNRLYTSLLHEPLETRPLNGGLVIGGEHKVIIPNGFGGESTFFWKVVPLSKLTDYKTGDKIKAVFVVRESVAGSMTQTTPNRIGANLWASTAAGEIRNAPDSAIVTRLNTNTVKAVLTLTLIATDAAIRPGLFVYNTSNTSGANYEFTLLSLGVANLSRASYVSNSADVMADLVEQVDSNARAIKDERLANTISNTTLVASVSNGATYAAGAITIPIGQHGQTSFIQMETKISDLAIFSKMTGNTVTFEMIAKVSANLSDKRKLKVQATTITSGASVGDRALNAEIIYIDAEHVRLKFDLVVAANDTVIKPYIQITDATIVTGAAQTIELQNKLYFSWKDINQKNTNTQVLENALLISKADTTKALDTLKTDILNSYQEGDGINQWTGKKWLWFGTSIPWLYQPNSYPELIVRKLGATVVNRAIGGSKLLFNVTTPGMAGSIAENAAFGAEQSYQNILKPFIDDPYSFDMIVCDHLFNDAPFMPGALGTINSTDKATFYGAYDFIIKFILGIRWDIPLVLCTCPNRYPFGSVSSIAIYESLRTATITIADKWGFQVLDFGGKMGFNQLTAGTSGAPKKTYDGTHQTVAETEKMANVGYHFFKGVY